MRPALACCCLLTLLACSSPVRSPASRATGPSPVGAACALQPECDAGDELDGGAAGSNGAGAICTATGDCEQAVVVASANHVNGPIAYLDPPPAGGDHNPCWGAWGVHDQPLAPEHWVHNLEHGGVVFLYHCPDGCGAQVQQLADFVGAHRLTVLTEYDALPARFAVVAWGYRLLTDTLDLQAFSSFYAAHVDHAPESIDGPPPSGC